MLITNVAKFYIEEVLYQNHASEKRSHSLCSPHIGLFLLIALVSPLMLQTFRIKYRMSLKIMIMKLNMKSNM